MAILNFRSNPENPFAEEEKERERNRGRKSNFGKDLPQEVVIRAVQQREKMRVHFGNDEDRQKAEEKENQGEVDRLLAKNEGLVFTEKQLSDNPEDEEIPEEKTEINAVAKEGLDATFEKISELKG